MLYNLALINGERGVEWFYSGYAGEMGISKLLGGLPEELDTVTSPYGEVFVIFGSPTAKDMNLPKILDIESDGMVIGEIKGNVAFLSENTEGDLTGLTYEQTRTVMDMYAYLGVETVNCTNQIAESYEQDCIREGDTPYAC